MQPYVVHRPERAAMERILFRHEFDATGTIIRLAWLEGLLREEIVCLTWDNISFLNEQIELPDRRVPMLENMESYLTRLCESQSANTSHVVLSDRTGKPLTPQHASRLVREALNEEGQTETRLIDLRHDFIIRQLEKDDWQYVSRITGVKAVSLQLHFAEYLPAKQISTRVQSPGAPQIDEFRLWKLLHEERDSISGLALRLTWQAGLYLNEIAELTWGQMDADSHRLNLESGRVVELRSDLLGALQELGRGKPDDAHVILSPRAHKPVQQDRLSKLARAALIRGGLDNVTLRDLRMDYELRTGGEDTVIHYIQKHRSITRNELMDLLHISKKTAYSRLKLLTQREKLVRIGTRYYLPNTVIPPEKQRRMVLMYLRETGVAYRGDIAELLHLEPAQCSVLLKHMVDSGEIDHKKQKYCIKGA